MAEDPLLEVCTVVYSRATAGTHGTASEAILGRKWRELFYSVIRGVVGPKISISNRKFLTAEHKVCSSTEAKRCSVVQCKGLERAFHLGIHLHAIQMKVWMMKLPLKLKLCHQLTYLVLQNLLCYHLKLSRSV